MDEKQRFIETLEHFLMEVVPEMPEQKRKQSAKKLADSQFSSTNYKNLPPDEHLQVTKAVSRNR